MKIEIKILNKESNDPNNKSIYKKRKKTAEKMVERKRRQNLKKLNNFKEN